MLPGPTTVHRRAMVVGRCQLNRHDHAFASVHSASHLMRAGLGA